MNSGRLRILLSNDDGFRAAGLRAMAEALSAIAEVMVVAPETNRSGASNSLTLDRPLRARAIGEGSYAIDGTPADCVNLALTGLLAAKPDLVVSGINTGENLGEDVLYSGTVAAAMEGALLGYPAIAVSLANADEQSNFAVPAAALRDFIARAGTLPAGTLLNVNFPLESKGASWCATRLGRRHKDTRSVRQLDPKNRPMYWIGPTGSPGFDAGPGTDFHAIAQQLVSVTPLQTDLTAYSSLEDTTAWLREGSSRT